jgi:hypothetical protein
VDGRAVVHQRAHLRDEFDRYLQIYGINLASIKAPMTEEFPSLYPLTDDPVLRQDCLSEFPLRPECVPSRDVSYIGRPFPLEEAENWYRLLAELGFNSVRLITNWESIQPYRPGTCAGREGYTTECYDLAYLDYYESLIEAAAKQGIYVLVDMHQDIFSRFLMAYYNEEPRYGPERAPVPAAEGSLEANILALFPPYTDWVRGHGAPRWVVENCLPEKDLDSPYWGMFRGIGALRQPDGNLNGPILLALQNLMNRFTGESGGADWVNYVLNNVPPEHFAVNETNDFLPLAPWALQALLSFDLDRCFAAFFAGDEVFPNLAVNNLGRTVRRDEVEDGDELPSLKSYLQGEFLGAWRVLARRARGHENVIGYDILNEPVGGFIMLSAMATFLQTGVIGAIESVLTNFFGDEMGSDLYSVMAGLALIPPDAEEETLELWGLADIDTVASYKLNITFDANFLQPFYELVGQAIQEEDPEAIVWFEPATSLRMMLGPSTFWDQPLTRPQGIRQLVYAPHWYPDIYPFPGIGARPRHFNQDEWLYRDFTDSLQEFLDQSPAWLGNVPVVFGEFGSYFNFNGIQHSIDTDYEITAHVLNSYYEAFEKLNAGNMLWCFSADNDYDYGEWWNHEDFSIVGPGFDPALNSAGDTRAWAAFVRPHLRASSGKLLSQRFYSQFHFWDPVQGQPRPERTYELQMEMRESDAPTEVFVPSLQYPDGFYVWLSDGQAYFDDERQMLYWYASREEPGTVHTLKIEPLLDDREALGWSYFFANGRVVVGAADELLTGGVDVP